VTELEREHHCDPADPVFAMMKFTLALRAARMKMRTLQSLTSPVLAHTKSAGILDDLSRGTGSQWMARIRPLARQLERRNTLSVTSYVPMPLRPPMKHEETARCSRGPSLHFGADKGDRGAKSLVSGPKTGLPPGYHGEKISKKGPGRCNQPGICHGPCRFAGNSPA
jgi:hypothetical protein